MPGGTSIGKGRGGSSEILNYTLKETIWARPKLFGPLKNFDYMNRVNKMN